jgi:HD-GYP domain-containing protein (c-di-GMP phosphodiesterase class II)
MQLDEDFLQILRISAQLHDVGKIGIEDHILKKPGALTPEEFEVMKTHTTKGANLLRPVTQLKDMLPGIELHHESLDGRGYPYGLKGEEIPLLARVIAVADTFDALTTNRPYQRAYEPKEALKIIHSLAGKRLDPQAVAAITAVYERGEIRVQRLRTVVAPPPPAPDPVPPPVPEPTPEPAEVNAAAAAAAGPSAKPPALSETFIQTTRF